MRVVAGLGLLMLPLLTSAMAIKPIGTARTQHRFELKVTGVPFSPNPFDPARIALDATITRPDGTSYTVPAFYYQGYTHSLDGTQESLSPKGMPDWRIRLMPRTVGTYSVSLSVKLNGLSAPGPSPVSFEAMDGGPIKPYVTGSAGSFLRTDLGSQLPLIGYCMCWHGSGGTFDYQRWFSQMKRDGGNSTRIWMCPWAFGLETDKDSLNRYRLDKAWQLDTVMGLAEADGIYVQLCLDYHGMFAVNPDYWGGNNFWPLNPYNQVNGGPCVDQKAFFALPEARRIYKKRLRYMIARYGYSPSLLAWEFFNEIDCVYEYLDPNMVADWFGEMSRYVHAHDPYGHLVTTSYVNPDRPEVWSIPGIDVVEIHPYGWTPTLPAISDRVQSLAARYGKPVVVAEFGTDSTGWNRDKVDPYLRGYRQGLWAGALGGAANNSWSWWWEDIERENLYPYYKTLHRLLSSTSWGSATTRQTTFVRTGELESLGGPIEGSVPFDATLALNSDWGGAVTGELALANPEQASRAGTCLNAFIQGQWHPDIARPFKVVARFAADAKLTLHLNSVSEGAIMQVLVDGNESYRWAIPNKDGAYEVNHEYDLDVVIPVPQGRHLVEVRNPGQDWFYLDWVRFSGVKPSRYRPSPVALGQDTGSEIIVYCVNPAVLFPANALTADISSLIDSKLTVVTGVTGNYTANWYRPTDGTRVRTATVSTATDRVSVGVPPIAEDLFLVLRIR